MVYLTQGDSTGNSGVAADAKETLKNIEERSEEKMEKTTMSIQELSAEMGISLPKAYELVKAPGFPILRIGRRILIPVVAYKEWLIKNVSSE